MIRRLTDSDWFEVWVKLTKQPACLPGRATGDGVILSTTWVVGINAGGDEEACH